MNRPQPTTLINRQQKRPALASRRHEGGRRRRVAIALAAFSSALALVIAGCGSSSTSSSASNGSPSSGSAKGSPSSYGQSQLAAAKCIRSHGVPNFPDPSFGAGGAQVNLSTPKGMLTSAAFALAQKECAKLGLELAGYVAAQEKPSATTLAQARAVAKCMRAHGAPNFPDPRTAEPSNPDSYGSVANMNGVIWAIPKSIDPQSPAVKQAAADCGPNADAVIGS